MVQRSDGMFQFFFLGKSTSFQQCYCVNFRAIWKSWPHRRDLLCTYLKRFIPAMHQHYVQGKTIIFFYEDDLGKRIATFGNTRENFWKKTTLKTDSHKKTKLNCPNKLQYFLLCF